MEKPSQFGGTECTETQWERLACPTATTQCVVTDYCSESFTCQDTGKSHQYHSDNTFSLSCRCLSVGVRCSTRKCVSETVSIYPGRCISPSLRCNGESDCDDFSDEEGCEHINRRDDKCSTLMPIPGAERGTQG